MTEKEKCKQGLLYNANYDKELVNERMLCKDLCWEYNQTKTSDLERSKELIKQIISNTRENFSIEAPFYCDYGYNIDLGENFFANHNLVILDEAKVTFGDNVLLVPIAVFTQPGIRLMRNKGRKASNMLDRFQLVTMFGLEAM